jgi:hypothetical protein
MKYIKYFEGFTDERLKDLISNGETYVDKISRSRNNKELKYSQEIINYDISNFEVEVQYNNYKIYPDLNFIKLYKKYCTENSIDSEDDLQFIIEILPEYPLGGYNFIDVYNLLPLSLKGLSLGYKLYKLILRKVDFIMTDKNSSNESINLWYSILKDDEVYSGTNNKFSIIIKKDIDDVKLKSILDKIGKFTLIYDDDLNTKINEIYG